VVVAQPGPRDEPESPTVFGLPRRMRTTNRETAPAPTPDGAPKPRTPEDVRMLMSAYQSGTRRAREDAARFIPPHSPATGSVEP
jgi:hypothetical protein